MDEYLKKLYKKYDLDDWFDLEAYEFEPTPARWAEIINIRLMSECFTPSTPKRTSFKEFQTSNPDLSDFNEEDFNYFRLLDEGNCVELRNFLLRSYDDFREYRNSDKEPNKVAFKETQTELCTQEDGPIESLRPVDYLLLMDNLVDLVTRFQLADPRFLRPKHSFVDDQDIEDLCQKWAEFIIRGADKYCDDIETHDLKIDNSSHLYMLAYDKSEIAHNHIKVNLSAPDEVLTAAFAEWLSTARSQHKYRNKKYEFPKSKFSNFNLRSWKDNKVLPYFDLTLWAGLHDKKISRKDMGDILFPDERFGDIILADRVGKVVRVQAGEVFTQPTADALRALAKYEHSRKTE